MKSSNLYVKTPFQYMGILLLVTSMCMLGCDRVTDFEGPDLQDIYGDFSILEDFSASTAQVDFSKGETLHFKARFSTITNWKIEITSLSNGGMKVIEGRSKTIDASNANWDGTTTKFPRLGLGNCIAVLYVEADSSQHQTAVQITGIFQPQGKLIADFETPVNPAWKFFVQSGANMSFRIEAKMQAPEGGKYFDMGGTVNWDWLIGMFDIPSSSMGSAGFDLSNNPEDLYFNAIIYRPDSLPNGFLLLRFSEDENGDGKFNESNEDQYAVEIRAFESGWNVISVKYSDLAYLVNGNPGSPKGNGVKNPDKLNMVSCLFLANPASGYAQLLMDYMIFTTGGPLKI